MYEVSLEMEKEFRKQFNLPITKELIYYDLKKNVYKVLVYGIYEEYETFKELKLKLDNGKNVIIHEDYFREMQKPNFLDKE